MIVLEEILNDLGCEKPFDENRNFTQSGNETYNKLINILYNVRDLTNRDDIASIIDELDKISND